MKKENICLGVTFEERLHALGFCMISGLPCGNNKSVEDIGYFHGQQYWEEMEIQEDGPVIVFLVKITHVKVIKEKTQKVENLMVAKLPSDDDNVVIIRKVLRSLRTLPETHDGRPLHAYKLCFGHGLHFLGIDYRISDDHITHRRGNMNWDPSKGL